MQTVNDAVKRKLEKYPRPAGKLAIEAITLAERHGSETVVVDQLKMAVRKIVRQEVTYDSGNIDNQ